MSELYLGQITLIANTYAPVGTALCVGSLLNVQQNAALFSLLGVRYGGDGTSTFGIPDLRNRVPLGSTSATGPIATGGGTSTVNAQGVVAFTLSVANLPAHSHPSTFMASGGSSGGPVTVQAVTGTGGALTASAGAYLGSSPTGSAAQAGIFYPGSPTPTSLVTLGGVSGGGGGITGGAVSVGTTGSGSQVQAPVQTQAIVSTMPPFQTVNYIIYVEGLYPPRP